MKINDSKLYGRVILGYIIVFFIIACMSLIFIYQKIKLEDINNKQYQINLVHSKISVLPLYVNKLSSLSESVFTWNYRDYLEYQRNRLFTDSILQDIKIHCNGFIQIEQVDSLCNMLEQKEYSLLHIMRTIKSKEKSDSLFFESQIPKKSLKTRTVTRKKKGLAGFFGKTETVQEPYYVIEYSELKKKTNIDHKNYLIQIEMESDSLIITLCIVFLGCCARTFYDYIGWECYKGGQNMDTWWPWYVFRPIIGVPITAFLIVAFRTSMFSSLFSSKDLNTYLIVSFLAGFAMMEFVTMLRRSSKALFGSSN